MTTEKKQDQGQKLWYAKRKGKILGPFPSGALRRFVLIGRVRIDDYVSSDKKDWQKVSEVPEVVPREVRKAIAEGRLDTLFPDKLREDERTGRERRSNPSAPMKGRKGERREDETDIAKQHRKKRDDIQRLRENRKRPMVGIIVVGVLVVFGMSFGLYLGAPEPIPDPDCDAQPSPRVNWRNCRLDQVVHESVNLDSANLSSASLRGSRFSGAHFNAGDLQYADFGGADLSYTELTQARMKGATLVKADLSYADLSKSDLSYANLRGANLGGALLADVIFDHAIWVDGQTCLPGSLGTCRVTQ